MSKSYKFYMEILPEGGEWVVLEWFGLTLQEAKDLYKKTETNCTTSAVKTYGWELVE